ncbi:MAG: MBL fold metallo-hydrolase [Alphaproteobacteria bacterium]|nr:MBL fold metallo-hydrolase [Alphaproteobacteria bacterium]
MADPAPWGTLRVTRRCCGAGVCRNLAPGLLAEVSPEAGVGVPLIPGSWEPGAFTGVVRQPATLEEHLAARAAVAACAFGALRMSRASEPVPAEHRGSPWKRFPRALEPGVWVVGQPSSRNYGALSYYLERPEGGVLVDPPKPTEALFRWLEAHGGVAWLVLTHRDHAQHHAEVAARFPGCRRVLGAADVNRRASRWEDATDDVEVQVQDTGLPCRLDGSPITLEALPDEELALLPQPGHTPGGMCLLYRGRYLFTGDHLSWSSARRHLVAHRLVCWEDWERQTASVGVLRGWARAGHLRFTWVLPGHGEWGELPGDGGPAATAEALDQAVRWMEAQPPGRVSLMRWVPFVLARTKPEARFGRWVRRLGGGLGEAWLLPRAVRGYLPDYAPEVDAARRRRVAGAVALAAAAGAVLAWEAARGGAGVVP